MGTVAYIGGCGDDSPIAKFNFADPVYLIVPVVRIRIGTVRLVVFRLSFFIY